jgi:hypothetical protein
MDLQEILSAVKALNLPPLEPNKQLDLDYYTKTANRLNLLGSLKTALEVALSTVTAYMAAANEQHNSQTVAIKKILANPSKSYSRVIETPSKPVRPRTDMMTVEIVPGISLPAISVQTFSQVGTAGALYYVQTADHFALRLGNKLLHGNIGTIFMGDKPPERIRECRYATCNEDSCEFYHDPIKYPGKKDHRNFVTNAWVYNAPDQRKTNRGRNYGSRQYLSEDLLCMTGECARRFTDQAFHDLLCALLLPS